ncbi:hypothetical protein GCM10017621_27410 [Maricaulis virginensis]|uniref:Uncharacterized protein n=1 Tax=Maricaulis virginensis TaxID=144022 RepID=A0A9W6MPI3_9PROT|nr:hypothetical protein GCM10017621_27410 [Maricaulis virginensis]
MVAEDGHPGLDNRAAGTGRGCQCKQETFGERYCAGRGLGDAPVSGDPGRVETTPAGL